MSCQPVTIPTGLLIFKDPRPRFWVTEWYKIASATKIREMSGLLVHLMAQGRLKIPIARTLPPCGSPPPSTTCSRKIATADPLHDVKKAIA